jgi:hypothetical protein
VALEQRSGEEIRHGECRRCRTFCDKVIDVRGCLEMRCPNLYSYEDALTGASYMGCVRKVFRAEVDTEMFGLAEATGGFGGLKMTGEPLPQCQFRVEPAYEGSGADHACVNPRFFDCADSGPQGIRAFDLRDSLR